jgi:hypothetical protein
MNNHIAKKGQKGTCVLAILSSFFSLSKSFFFLKNLEKIIIQTPIILQAI